MDLASSKRVDETPEPDDYDPHRLASSVAALQDLWALDSGPAGSAAPLERVLTLGALGCSQFAEKELSRLWKIDRPYLMVDVEPASRSCELICSFVRDRLAARAKLEWSKDHAGPDAVLPLPPLLDSANARMALGQAQKVDDTCNQIIWQKRKELDPKWGHRTNPKASMVQPLKPLELAEYRLAPDDEVLEKRVLLGS